MRGDAELVRAELSAHDLSTYIRLTRFRPLRENLFVSAGRAAQRRHASVRYLHRSGRSTPYTYVLKTHDSPTAIILT
jgi:hypothetical protein